MVKPKRKKVRRITPRPRNAPKPLDDGTQHFRVAISQIKVPDAVPEPRLTHVEEKPHMSEAEAEAVLAANVKGYAAPPRHETPQPPICEMKSQPAINEEGWCDAALCVLGWIAALFLGGSLAGFGIITGMRAALRWWLG
jgi:hypothetical protein